MRPAWVGAEEVVADVAAVGDRVLLVLAIDDLVHALGQAAVDVLFQQRIPVVAPDHLDDVPASTAKTASSSCIIFPLPRTGPSRRWRLQFTTQMRLLSCSRAARVSAPKLSGSSHSPSPKRPTPCYRQRLEAAVFEVAVEASLIDRQDWPQAHRHGWELPKVRHQPRVRIGGEATAFLQFAAEVFELVFVEAAFDEGAGVHAGGSVPLEVYLVAGMAVARGAEEVVVANLVEGR